jgi:hypothetical protein
MNPTEQLALEQINKVNLKSTLAQIHEAFLHLQNVKQDIDDIYVQLNKKVNLVSDMLDGQTTSKVLGPGTVSVSGSTVTGTGTNFLQYVSITDQIQVGAELETVLSIQDDTHLTTVNPFVTAYTNNIYAIIRPATRERLIGDFEFGQLNGQQFRGVIQAGSYLEQYGRIATPNDVVNVQFLQKTVSPAIVLAQNAIRRSGDKVGIEFVTGVPPTSFQFINTSMTFDAHSSVYFNGTIDDTTLLGRTQFATVGYVQQLVADQLNLYKTQLFFAQWVNDSVQSLTPYGGYYPLFSVAPLVTNSHTPLGIDDFNQYFQTTSAGLLCLKPCSVLVICNTFQDRVPNNSHSSGALWGQITHNTTVLSFGSSSGEASNAHGASHGPSFTCSAVVECAIGDHISCGVVSNVGGAIHAYTSLLRLR